MHVPCRSARKVYGRCRKNRSPAPDVNSMVHHGPAPSTSILPHAGARQRNHVRQRVFRAVPSTLETWVMAVVESGHRTAQLRPQPQRTVRMQRITRSSAPCARTASARERCWHDAPSADDNVIPGANISLFPNCWRQGCAPPSYRARTPSSSRERALINRDACLRIILSMPPPRA